MEMEKLDGYCVECFKQQSVVVAKVIFNYKSKEKKVVGNCCKCGEEIIRIIPIL